MRSESYESPSEHESRSKTLAELRDTYRNAPDGFERALAGQELDKREGNIFEINHLEGSSGGTISVRPVYEYGGREYEVLIDTRETRELIARQEIADNVISLGGAFDLDANPDAKKEAKVIVYRM